MRAATTRNCSMTFAHLQHESAHRSEWRGTCEAGGWSSAYLRVGGLDHPRREVTPAGPTRMRHWEVVVALTCPRARCGPSRPAARMECRLLNLGAWLLDVTEDPARSWGASA